MERLSTKGASQLLPQAAAPHDHPQGIYHVSDCTYDQRRAPQLLALALELAHFPLVPDLLCFDVPLVSLDLPELFPELEIP